MKTVKNELHIGVETPFCVLHASDTHITFADERDTRRKLELAADREKIFPDAAADLVALEEKARREGRTVVYTGDLIDFVSELNFEKAKAFCRGADVFMAAGNHEFSQYVGEAKEDAAYRNLSLPRVQSIFKNDIRCASRIIGGVNFVAIDNSYYFFEEAQLAFLRQQTQREYPVILCVHVPLYTKELYDFMIERDGYPAYLMSVPEALMQNYTADRYEQQKQDAITAEAYDFIVNCPNIKAVLAGHLHKNYEGRIHEGLPQLVTGLSTVREIYID
ncbi:MAG: metallophosphoesterase [Firmicutes bacterium]|nr:metallophosphoesterase [Bacillota bacterium]